MIRAMNRFLSAQSQTRTATTACVLVGVIGLVDHLSGYEISFSIFYLIPVALAAWYIGKSFGLAVCVLSATVWLIVDTTAGHEYSNTAIPLWNAAVRLGLFVIVAYLLEAVRKALALQEALAQQDSLTGIANSRAFKQKYLLLAPLAARQGRALALGYIDVDDFKIVNDRLGHHVGDQVLCTIAAKLAGRVRTSDVVGRMGGDEFAVLLAGTSLVGARSLFTDIRERLLAIAKENGWPIGFSIGVALLHSPPGNVDDAIRCADKLMYKVKNTGKNSILFEEYRDNIRSPASRAEPASPVATE